MVFCTCPDWDEAMRLGRAIVDRELAACVNVLPGVASIYRWQGKVEQAQEVLLVAKTGSAQFDALRAYIEEAHTYDLPEVLALPVVDGNARYLDWILANIKRAG
jgi:periplasmic divalent cation tolerance protein